MKTSLRIAIADDEHELREYLEKTLPRLGHQVVCVAEDGLRLVELCRVIQPDLIITDLNMPGQRGDDAVRSIGGDPTIPLIVVSAFPMPAQFGEGLTEGSWVYLHKPIKSKALEEAIQVLTMKTAPTETGNISVADPVGLVRSTRETSSAMASDNMKLRLMIVDDEDDLRADISQYFRKLGYRVSDYRDAPEAEDAVSRSVFDVAIVDLRLPSATGIELLEKLKGGCSEIEIIMLTGQGTIETAVESMKKGAHDFLTKPVRLRQLEAAVLRAHQAAQLKKENRRLRVALSQAQQPGQMIGQSPQMQVVYRLIQRTGPTNRPALIQGESGTGKELVARAIHEASALADKPMVTVNCAALPETLLESELFGHEKGAFTGAVSAKPGLFEVADGGTLFIDELGELAGPLQAKLLRVLEDGTMRRIGSVKELHVDVRIIAATNRDLQEEVNNGRFREDLFYRLNVLTIQLPPLRERTGDIPLLVAHFAGDDWKVDPEVIPALSRYSWPGNVRQLSNAIERAKILAEDDRICVENLPPEILQCASQESTPASGAADLEDLTRQHVLDTYSRCKENKARTARALGIGRRSLYRLLEKYGIHDPLN